VVDRPLLVAFLDGERSPNRPDARGILAGLSSATERESVALAAFEGVVLGLFTGFKALQGIGVDSGGRLILTGGASRSEAYRKIIARIFGKDVHAPEGDGGLDSARGAAIQAATVLQQRGIDEVAREWALPIVRVAEADCSFADRARILHEHYVRATQIRSLDGIWNTESASSAESI
jgi:xylulokinase